MTDFSIDDLTEKLVMGDYLALPLTVIIIVILFFLLVQITHVIFLALNTLTVEKVKSFLAEKQKKLGILSRTLEIIKLCFDIILDTIISILTFVKFVPDFFMALGKFVLQEDEDCEKDE